MEAVIETFKPVRGYDGLYEVSDYGCVRSLRSGKILKIQLKRGYTYTSLTNQKTKHFSIHRLVWEAFNCTIPEGMQIDHIDGDKTNNKLSNLRVVTPKENSNNPVTLERVKESNRKKARNLEWREKMRKSKKRSTPVVQINIENNEVIRTWNTASEACRELGINNGNLSSCCHGKQNTAGGFKWCFA